MGLGTGFRLYSTELQAVLPPPTAKRERQLGKMLSAGRIRNRREHWESVDTEHYETVAKRCRVAVMTVAGEDILRRVGASNDTLSVSLHTAASSEQKAAKQRLEAMEQRSLIHELHGLHAWTPIKKEPKSEANKW